MDGDHDFDRRQWSKRNGKRLVVKLGGKPSYVCDFKLTDTATHLIYMHVLNSTNQIVRAEASSYRLF